MKEPGYADGEPTKELSREEAEKEVLTYLDNQFIRNGGDVETAKPESNENGLLTIWTARAEAKNGNWDPALEYVRDMYKHHYSESSRHPSTDNPESTWTVADSAHEAENLGALLNAFEG